jgi:hypothetical protein
MATDYHLELQNLADKIESGAEDRYTMQPALHALILQMQSVGLPVDAKFLSLERSLRDEAVEAQFDNLPV